MSTVSNHSGKVVASQVLALTLLGSSLVGCAVAATSEEEAGSSQDELLVPVDLVKDKPVILKPFPFPRPTPFPVPDPEELLEITAGNAHTCVRKRSGDVYCWGRDDLGQAGQLPTGNCQSSPNQCVDRPRKVFTLGGFPGAMQIEAGDHHTCSLDASGKAYCWGNSNNGQLGIGTNGYQSEPIAVAGGLTFTSISAGTMTTCGTTGDGMFCWGLPIASTGGPLAGYTSPFRVYSATGLAPIGVSTGYAGVCALWVQGNYRETNCWGRNWEGQTGSPATPVTVLGQGPSLVGSSVQRVSTQLYFTCVDCPGPTVQCFGAGGSGQLGNGANSNNHAPQTVIGANGAPLALSNVTTGAYHACALDPNGAAYCWGYGSYGQLGNGLPPNGGPGISSNRANPVTGGLTFRAIAAGERHTCGIGTNNKIYCWGSNYHGELGTMFKSAGQPYTNGWVADPVQALDPI